MDLSLANAHLGLMATTTGGSVWRFFARQEHGDLPIFREPPAGADRAALEAGCFPLVPFGNRVRANRFSFEGESHSFTPNMPWDRHYLHGDGWTGEWQVLSHADDRLTLGFDHRGAGSPYSYSARHSLALDGRTLTLTLSVANTGDRALPFGLGWHPYFPLTPDTILRTRTRSFWDEDEAWMPTTEHPTGGDLDFSAGAPVPRRWVNTQFEGWDGQATVAWPERRIGVGIAADPVFDRSLLFVSDPAFDPGYSHEFFCYEPMSHSIDGHNRAGLGGLRRLAPGESLEGAVRFTVVDLPDRGPRA